MQGTFPEGRKDAGEHQKPAFVIPSLCPCVLSASSQLGIYQSEVQQMYFSKMLLVNSKTTEITQKLLKKGNSPNSTTQIQKDD